MSYQNQPTLLFHDYETWGVNPKKDHPAQFAAIRTDLELNEIAEPVEFFCYPPLDYLPNPEACLITGITPQLTQQKGTCEHEFIRKVLQEMSVPNTCSLGYNTIRFDDEVTRFTLYRNFFDPYAREWQNGNSRWDLIDLVRACYALRPDGINWPFKEDGSPSFKLEDLSKANGLAHENAHDAVSDVRATIEMARLVKQKQPKLYQYLFDLKDKRKVSQLIDINNLTPLVHVSSKLKATQGCCTWVCPIAWHPSNSNAVIVINLALNPTPLVELSVDEIKQKLFTSSENLAEGEDRLPVKLIHINKSPVLAPAKTLTPENADRLGINRAQCLDNLQFIKQHPVIREKLVQLYESISFDEVNDVDQALYQGFTNPADKALMEQIQAMPVNQYADLSPNFTDPKFNELWFRFKARNYPHLLNESEILKWQVHCKDRLTDENNLSSLNFSTFTTKLESLVEQHSQDEGKIKIIKSLFRYIQHTYG
ncbi:exodeoxyribonuclease I [Catenovulum sp. 2E275]|uniref:exodeoxyribonuclease I n=1 Tax=Catenovulum sp. 2E275 TaxID=2980497 RepID=UPI0021D2FC25|nr:exodeoxyribonuclease I [Catenovulum sp. 2E275]MCU4674497.1 exodeoxyribonuclease I [Catenovulum sp. 2E275]